MESMFRLTSCGKQLDTSPSAFGELACSIDYVDDGRALRQRMTEDGYLFFRGFFATELVLEARRQVLLLLAEEGVVDDQFPLLDAIAVRDTKIRTKLDGRCIPGVRELLHEGRLPAFFDAFLEGESRALDYIWMRMKSPGMATAPHYDFVYMNRGTRNLYTSWVPLGDVPTRAGSLIILERSHLIDELKTDYATMDIDKDGNRTKIRFRHGQFFRGGKYSKNAPAVQRQFGRRWLTTDFRAGDVCLFTPFTMHGTLDNSSDTIRLSADTRFQLASEPIDERWVGDNPIGHSYAE